MKPFTWRSELLLALVAVLSSLLLLPGMVYLVGSRLFGTYPNGLPGLYAAQLEGLLRLEWPAWTLAAVPALALLVCRAIWRWTMAPANGEVTAARPRREPRLGT
jgi:hypothetical protein